MSIVGLDFGNLSVLIGQASRGGVDVILNDSSNRQTASYVSIQGKQRFLGDSGAAMARSNITNTFSCMKLLVGRRFDSPDVQKELQRASFKAGEMPNGSVGILVQYNNEDILVSAEHAMAMVLVKAKEVAFKANGNVGMADAVMAVPHWFSDTQRRGVLHACQIADINCLKVANESTLIGLSYGIFKSAKKMFSDTEPAHTMFIDIGYTGYCVTIVDYVQENMSVLATVCDRELGGRNIDDVIIEYLAESFQKKTGINIRGNVKAELKLQAAAEKAKKTLSPNGVVEAAVSVECLADDKDLSCTLTKDEFEIRVASLIARLEAPVLECLREAGIDKSQLAEVEIVGGTSRVAIIKRKLGEILGLDASAMNYGLKTTMNSDEAVARGGALQCAMMSVRMKVKPFNMVDKLPYGLIVHYDLQKESVDENSKMDENAIAQGESTYIFRRNDDLPRQPERLTFHNKSADFVLTVTYDEASKEILPVGETDKVAKYTIRVPPELVADGPKSVRVNFHLDKHGAELFEEVTTAELNEEKKGDEKMDVSEGKEEEKLAETPQKRFKSHELVVLIEAFGLTRDQLKAACELEASMAFEDKLITETADKRNELEAYLYSMRDKLDGTLKPYGSNEDKDQLKALMNSAEDWLYGDGFDSTKQHYTRKIDELKAFSDPMEIRNFEAIQRGPLIERLREQMDTAKNFANNKEESTAHITDEERDSLRDEVSRMECWINENTSAQSKFAQYLPPVLTENTITKQSKALNAVSNPIYKKPKPKAVIPTPAPAPSESKDENTYNNEEKNGSGEGKDSEEKEVEAKNEEKKEEEKEEGKNSNDEKTTDEAVPMSN